MVEVIWKNIFTPGSQQVTVVGLGGEGILRTKGRIPHARRAIQEALFPQARLLQGRNVINRVHSSSYLKRTEEP